MITINIPTPVFIIFVIYFAVAQYPNARETVITFFDWLKTIG